MRYSQSKDINQLVASYVRHAGDLWLKGRGLEEWKKNYPDAARRLFGNDD